MVGFPGLLAVFLGHQNLLGYLSHSSSLQFGEGTFEDIVRRPLGCDLNQQAQPLVELDQWSSTSFIGIKAYFDRFWPVIFPLKEGAVAAIAFAVEPRGPFGHVIDRLTLLACSAAAQPSHNFAEWERVIHYRS